jgi:hypothetical protein
LLAAHARVAKKSKAKDCFYRAMPIAYLGVYLVFRLRLNIRLNNKYATPLRSKERSFCFFATLALLRMAVKQSKHAALLASPKAKLLFYCFAKPCFYIGLRPLLASHAIRRFALFFCFASRRLF